MSDFDIASGIKVVEDAGTAITDPDGYYFPRIAGAVSRDVAVKLLDNWKLIKVTQFKALGKSNQETLAIESIYNAKLAEINAKFNGTPSSGGMSPRMITALVAIGILALAYHVWKSSKKKSRE